jgi:hypothetical protein
MPSTKLAVWRAASVGAAVQPRKPKAARLNQSDSDSVIDDDSKASTGSNIDINEEGNTTRNSHYINDLSLDDELCGCLIHLIYEFLKDSLRNLQKCLWKIESNGIVQNEKSQPDR